MAKNRTVEPDQMLTLPEDSLPVSVGELQSPDWASMSYEDVLALYSEQMVTADAETMGDGFEKLPTKDQLIGVPFVIIRGTFTAGIGKHGEKVTVRVITATGQRYFFSDGSTGMYKQLRTLCPPPTNSFGQVNVPKGLRASRFHWDDVQKKITEGPVNAATYYLDVS